MKSVTQQQYQYLWCVVKEELQRIALVTGAGGGSTWHRHLKRQAEKDMGA